MCIGVPGKILAIHDGLMPMADLDFGGTAQPIGIDVDQIGPVSQGGVDAGEHESRGNDALAHAHPVPKALGECGLAGTELPGED